MSASTPSAYLTAGDIGAMLQLGRSAGYALTQRRGFPTPVVLSDRCYRWPEHEVHAWLESQRR